MKETPGWRWRPRNENKDLGKCAVGNQGGMGCAQEVRLSCSDHPPLPSMGPSQVLIPGFQEPEVTQHRMAGVQLWVISPLELTLPRRGRQWGLLPSEGKGCRRGFRLELPGFPPQNTSNSSALSLVPVLAPHKLTPAYLTPITDEGCPQQQQPARQRGSLSRTPASTSDSIQGGGRKKTESIVRGTARTQA